MTMRPLLAAAALGLVAACAQPQTRPAQPTSAAPKSPAQPALAGAVGQPRNCVGLRQIRESLVKSDQVIDFVMLDGAVLRNRLPYSCPQLGFERAFSYETSLSQLCSTDIITVIQQGGGVRRGASCGLGQFVPISPEAAKAPLSSQGE